MDRTGQGFVALRRCERKRRQERGRPGWEILARGTADLTDPTVQVASSACQNTEGRRGRGRCHWVLRLLCRLRAVVGKIPGQRATDEEGSAADGWVCRPAWGELGPGPTVAAKRNGVHAP